MTTPLMAYVLINAVCAVIAAAAALVVLDRRHLPGGLALGLTLLAIGEFALSRLFELTAADLATKLLWFKIGYVGSLSMPVLLLVFAAQYGGYSRWAGRRTLALLWLVPAISFVLAITNEHHGLIWSRVALDPSAAEGVMYGHGPAFWFGVLGYSYLLVAIATVLIVRKAMEWHRLYRRRAVLMLVAIAVPWIGSAGYVAGLTTKYVDLAPMTFTLSGVLAAFVVVRYRLLDLLPVARGQLIEELGDGVLVLDQSGRVQDVNPAAGRLLRLQPANMLGKSLLELPPIWRDALQHAAQQPGKPQEIEVEQPGAAGGEAMSAGASGSGPEWVELRVSRLKAADALQRGRLVVLHPITERKRAEQALNRLNAELEQRVAERTAALEQRSAELLAANARLTELAQLKSKFIADVSHELRTPVTNLALYASLLQRGKPEKRDKYLETLAGQITLLSGLVGDILDFGRLAIPQAGPAFGPVDLNAVVAEVVEIQRPRAEAGGLELCFKPGDGLPSVQGDVPGLRRVVENLVVNAISYTPAGLVEVATSENESPPGVRLSVRDTGVGIGPVDLPHIFARFYRGQGVGQSNLAGAGLGLPIVKEIVDAHRGTIGVETEPGRGSTFLVDFPAAR